jgi:hypothetical protein
MRQQLLLLVRDALAISDLLAPLTIAVASIPAPLAFP